jgi:hypothetical protein
MEMQRSKHRYFAEIVESSLTSWTAQSWQWDTFPEFGSLVTITTKKRTIFGIVYEIKTGSMEQGRYPFTYQKTEEELMAEQPQIFEFLKTTFSCLTLGFQEHDVVVHQLAPEPPKIHAFVGPILPTHYKPFFNNTGYLHLMFAASEVCMVDELLLALLSNLQKNNVLTEEKLYNIIDAIALLSGNDYRRLKILMSRISCSLSKP